MDNNKYTFSLWNTLKFPEYFYKYVNICFMFWKANAIDVKCYSFFYKTSKYMWNIFSNMKTKWNASIKTAISITEQNKKE